MESPAVQKNKTECKMAIRNEEPHVNKCFPRARGDVPRVDRLLEEYYPFSPRTRGCSQRTSCEKFLPIVFPAHAGMFLKWCLAGKAASCFPRARGDVPSCKSS